MTNGKEITVLHSCSNTAPGTKIWGCTENKVK